MCTRTEYFSPQIADYGLATVLTGITAAGTQPDGAGALRNPRSSHAGSAIETASETNGD
jgi:hypothetical protein